MIIFFIQTKDLLQKAVKRESSLLAVRRRDQQGNEMLMELVFDEEYDITLKQYMNDAHAEVISNIAATYLIDTPTDLKSVYTEFPDFSQERDFNLFLNMHDDWPLNYHRAVDIKLQNFLIDYIMYRWLETKSPQDAKIYYTRLNKTLLDIRILLTRKSEPLKLIPSFP